MTRAWLWVLPLLLAGCDGVHPLFGGVPGGPAVPTPCRGLEVTVLDQLARPPANVLARLDVRTCEGAPLGRPIEPGELALAEDDVPLDELEAPRVLAPIERATRHDVIVLLDLSGSIRRGGHLPAMVDGARALVAAIAEHRRVAIYGFDGRPALVPFAELTADRAFLDDALARVASAAAEDDSTNLNGAIVEGLALLDAEVASAARQDGALAQGTLVVFTDGRDRARRVEDETAAAAVRRSTHEVLAIALGADGLEALGELGKSGVFPADRPERLGDAFAAAAERLRAAAGTELVLGYCSPARAGTRVLRIDVATADAAGAAELAFSAEGFRGGCAPSLEGLGRR